MEYETPSTVLILLESELNDIDILCKSHNIFTKYNPIPEPSVVFFAFFPRNPLSVIFNKSSLEQYGENDSIRIFKVEG